ncbi:MAG: hypothetical protein RLZZ04_492 [Cyanobacteriota bacterium]|jgi:hypothetical protein
MVVNFPDIENIAIPLPITSENRAIACNFARQQATQQKAKQVLYNTLAVLTVKNYLEMLGVATDLSNSDSWNPVMRACDNVADLNVLDLGSLECRPLQSLDISCHIPMEVWDLRLGYVMVKIDDSLKKAELLGFMAQVASEEIAIADLQPMEALIDRLHDLRTLIANSSVINLGQWLDNIFTAGWSTVESLLNPEQLIPAWGFRNAESANSNSEQPKSTNETNNTRRAKLINLGIQLKDRPVVLLVDITPEVNGNIAVTLQVHPSFNDAYVPETLILRVIESSGQVFMEAQARSRDNFIQLQFSGESKELFTVQIVLDDAELLEQFQI